MSRVVPSHSTTTPISGLPELRTHLSAVEADPTIPLEAKLFDDVELQLTDENTPPLLPTLLPPLSTILKTTTQDPTPALTLTIKLLSPLPLLPALQLADPPSLLSALSSPLPGANLLALAILHKAAASVSDIDILATLPDLIRLLLQTWLSTPDTTVAERCARVLGDCLETDCRVLPPEEGPRRVNGFSSFVSTELIRRPRRTIPGRGVLWRMVFRDASFASVVVELCSPSPERTNNALTTSQGRLLRLLPRLAALDIGGVSSHAQPSLYPLPSGVDPTTIQPDLLPWAALSMVDTGDMLMRLTWIDFFETLVSVMRVSNRSAEGDAMFRALVRTAAGDEELRNALRGLPDRTVEEETGPLRTYISELLG